MIEVQVTRLSANFIFEIMNRTGCIDGCDRSAFGADQIIAMPLGQNESKVGCSLVQAQSSDDTYISESIKEPVNRRLVTLGRKRSGFFKVREGDGAVGLEQGIQENFKGLCSPESSGSATVNKVCQILVHRAILTPFFSDRQDFPLFPSQSRPTRNP